MKKVRARGEDVRGFILEKLADHPTDISKLVVSHFKISRQAANKHFKSLINEGAIVEKGQTKNKIYRLAAIKESEHVFKISKELAEDVIWRKDIANVLSNMPENVLQIWHYGFTEMFNNVIDHSKGSEVIIQIKKTSVNTEMLISDNGLGIFKKIQTEFNLLDERHALLELSKGKLTTDPKRHSGEGVFFTSRMFDAFDILSGGVYFSHKFGHPEDWILERDQFPSGTSVWLKLNNHTSRTTKKIFDQYTTDESYGFNKTVVPVRLAQYGNDQLISRSQARRLLARVELFKIVIFDFAEVEGIGQAFADEIFRVFLIEHPKIIFKVINENTVVKQMISRAKSKNDI